MIGRKLLIFEVFKGTVLSICTYYLVFHNNEIVAIVNIFAWSLIVFMEVRENIEWNLAIELEKRRDIKINKDEYVKE